MSNLIQYKNYHGKIEFSSDDGLFVGSVIGIRDSLNFHGTTVEEITQSFHDCIDGYLETCAAIGKSPDKEYKGSFNVRIKPELHYKAATKAEELGVSLNQFVADAIQSRLDVSATSA